MQRRLGDYSEFLSAIAKSFIERFEFHCEPGFSEIMSQPRLLIALNHSTPLSWLPAAAALAVEALKVGAGDRVPHAVMDRWFYKNPVTRFMAEYFTQYDQPKNFDELLEDFSHSERSDLVIFPEGANTFFGNVNEIQDFRSYRFIELAVRSQSPILLVVHKGSENWSMPLQLPREWGTFVLPFSRFFGEKILSSSTFNLPLMPQKLPLFQMSCELYWPHLKAVEFLSEPEDFKNQLKSEAENVRHRMQTLLAELH